jgi:hypothetical protein
VSKVLEGPQTLIFTDSCGMVRMCARGSNHLKRALLYQLSYAPTLLLI